MKPISNERMTWLKERLKVIELCIKKAQAEAYSMNATGAARQDLLSALLQFNSERMLIAVELAVLKDLEVAA